MSLLKKLFKYKVNYHKGCNNKIIIHKKNGKIVINPFFLKGITVNFLGNNNTLELYEPHNLKGGGTTFCFNSNSYYVLKQNVSGRIFVSDGTDAYLCVEENCTLQNLKIYLNDERGSSVKIGKDCMFSFDNVIWASDTHKIYEKGKATILNHSKYGVEIGNHVWCGTRCTILKDSKIADNSVIGAASLINKRFEETNVIVAGNPAKKIKDNIEWVREGFL